MTADIPSLAPRSDFPAVEEAVYLNTASIGLMAAPVLRSMVEFIETIAGRGTIGFDDDAETRVYEDTRAAAARLVGAEPVDVAITGSATEALGQLAWLLRPPAGSNVVSIDIEFPSVTYPWYRLADETGCEVRLVPALEDPAGLDDERIVAAIDERTAVVAISHSQYATGFTSDLRRIADAAHAVGARLVVDATQSAGIIPIDVRRDDVDALVAGAYKWLGGTFGAAAVYLKRDLWDGLRPAFLGWKSTERPFYFDAVDMPLARGARVLEYSTVSYPSGLALGEAIGYLERLGIERALAHAHALDERLIAGLDAFGAVIVSPRDGARRNGSVLARFPGTDDTALALALAGAGVHVSRRLGGIRFSPHVANDASDIDRALEIVERVVGRAAGAVARTD
jgi:selenocysteine lyase/cysteine desulfurase